MCTKRSAKVGRRSVAVRSAGDGKTMLARAAAHEAKAAFYAVKCSDVVSKWVGESERNIAALFDAARKNDRAVIFFDELDSLFFKRGQDVHNDRRVNELLQQIDGFSGGGAGLTVLGATTTRGRWTRRLCGRGGSVKRFIYPCPTGRREKQCLSKNSRAPRPTAI